MESEKGDRLIFTDMLLFVLDEVNVNVVFTGPPTLAFWE
jgi:hypothetical protein